MICLIQQAIKTRTCVSFLYHNHERFCEIYCLGNKRKELIIECYQYAGQSNSKDIPQFRRFKVEKITDFKLLEKTFINRYYWDKSSWESIIVKIN